MKYAYEDGLTHLTELNQQGLLAIGLRMKAYSCRAGQKAGTMLLFADHSNEAARNVVDPPFRLRGSAAPFGIHAYSLPTLRTPDTAPHILTCSIALKPENTAQQILNVLKELEQRKLLAPENLTNIQRTFADALAPAGATTAASTASLELT